MKATKLNSNLPKPQSASFSSKPQSASFSTKPNRLAPRSKIEPLPRQFFGRLVKLESDFINKDYTIETLDELTQLYAKAVEYYDSVKDEIASYFIYKIQDALATKQSLNILIDQSVSRDEQDLMGKALAENKSPKIMKKKSKKFGSSQNPQGFQELVVEEYSDEGEEQKALERKKNREADKENDMLRASFTRIKSKKQRDVALYCKVEKEKRTEKQNLTKTLEAFKKNIVQNDDLVQSEIDSQKLRLREKLEQKRQKTFASYTMTNSFSMYQPSAYNNRQGEDKRFESMLQELDSFDDNISNKDKTEDLNFLEGARAAHFGLQEEKIESLRLTPIKRREVADKESFGSRKSSDQEEKAEGTNLDSKQEGEENKQGSSKQGVPSRSLEVFKRVLQSIENMRDEEKTEGDLKENKKMQSGADSIYSNTNFAK